MDFHKLFETQRKFDATIKAHSKEDKIKKKVFALLVEVGEAANECPHTFKYWSSNPKSSTLKTAEYYANFYKGMLRVLDTDPLLDELVDQLHFLLSLGNEMNVSEGIEHIEFREENDVINLKLHFIHTITHLYFQWKSVGNSSNFLIPITYKQALSMYLTIVKQLGYSTTDLERAYYEKNKINYQRQKNGY